MGIGSLILGVISLVILFLVIVFRISFGAIPSICAIVGLVLGIIDNKKRKNRKATIGIVLCSVYILIFVILIVRAIFIVKGQLL